MEPVSPVIPGCEGFESVYAKGQPQYLPLPALHTPQGDGVVTRWRLTWRERLRILWTGNLYLEIRTFGLPLQPLKPSTTEPEWTTR